MLGNLTEQQGLADAWPKKVCLCSEGKLMEWSPRKGVSAGVYLILQGSAHSQEISVISHSLFCKDTFMYLFEKQNGRGRQKTDLASAGSLAE